MSNSTDILSPIQQELSSVDYQWVALESLSDVLCVLMAVFVAVPGVRKLWPYHEGYLGTKKGFIWLATTWGIPNYPHLFRTVIGLLELCVFTGCLMCFLPGPVWQLVTCLSLVLGISLCLCFLITHKSDPWKQLLGMMREIAQAALALGKLCWFHQLDFCCSSFALVLRYKRKTGNFSQLSLFLLVLIVRYSPPFSLGALRR